MIGCRRVDSVDFAYAIHTEVGDYTIGARVDGRLVPLESELDARRRGRGVHLEVARRGPHPRLAEFVEVAARRSKIRHWFTEERREEAIEEGKE